MAGSEPSTLAPTPVTDVSCMDFISSQNCRVSDVRCHLPNSLTYKHSCRCPVDRSDCYQYKTGPGENQTFSRSCPCTPYQPFVTSAIVFAIVAAIMFVACFAGLFFNRRSPRTIALRKAKVRQDPSNIQLVTDHDFDAWQTREAAMQNFGSNLVASVQATTDLQSNPVDLENVATRTSNGDLVQVNLDSEDVQEVRTEENPRAETIVHSIAGADEGIVAQIDIESQT